MNWLIDRLKEKSTWLGIFTLAGLLGIKIDPELREYIINAILAVAAVAAFVFKEKPELPSIEWSTKSNRVSDSGHSGDQCDPASVGGMSVQPDYSPKEPTPPVDQQSGWNN